MRQHKCFTNLERETIIAVANGAIVESIALMLILVIIMWAYLYYAGLGGIHYGVAALLTFVALYMVVKEWNLRLKL